MGFLSGIRDCAYDGMTTPSRPIYLDYHATTPCDPRVLEHMLPFFSVDFGNPSSGLHWFGRRAADAVEVAREEVSSLIGSDSNEIVFTSGATESNNLVIMGLPERAGERNRIVTSAVEHKAILDPCNRLSELGFDVVIVPVDPDGTVDLTALENAISDETLLVSIQAANNEIGTIQSLRAVTDLAHEYGALVHTDAAQAVGRIPFDVHALGVDFASISGHKMYGPKGVGALYVSRRARSQLSPLALGGGQEHGLRPGTINVPGVVGLGSASRFCVEEMDEESARICQLRNYLEEQLQQAIPELKINGNPRSRLSGNSSLTFPSIEADALILNLPELALSTGSACTSGALEPSHVLSAIGLTRDHANATIRIGIGRYSTQNEIAEAASLFPRAWEHVSQLP